jgi:hypothetical protein
MTRIIALTSAIQRMIGKRLDHAMSCVNILKMPGMADLGSHPLGAALRRRFRT